MGRFCFLLFVEKCHYNRLTDTTNATNLDDGIHSTFVSRAYELGLHYHFVTSINFFSFDQSIV